MILLIALGATAIYLIMVGAASGVVYPQVRRRHFNHCHLSRNKWCCEDHYYRSRRRDRECSKCESIQKFCGPCIWGTIGIVIFAPVLLCAAIGAIIPALLLASGKRLTGNTDMLGIRDRRRLRRAERLAELEKEAFAPYGN